MAPSSCICTPRMPNNRPFDVTKISEASFYIRMMMAPFVSRWPLLDRTPKLFPVIWKVYRRVSGGGGARNLARTGRAERAMGDEWIQFQTISKEHLREDGGCCVCSQ